MSATWMRRAKGMYSIFAVGLFAVLSVSAAQAVSLTATLRGSNEVLPNASLNTGTTVVNVEPGTGVLTWSTSTTIPAASVTGHHIHTGVAGVNGAVVVNFGGVYNGSIIISTTLAAQIATQPGSFYVNLHTAAFPGGEIRAQLVADPVVTPTLSTPVLITLALMLAGFAAFLFRRNSRA